MHMQKKIENKVFFFLAVFDRVTLPVQHIKHTYVAHQHECINILCYLIKHGNFHCLQAGKQNTHTSNII